MSKEEIIKELDRLKKDANEYSNYALMNEGYRVAIMDAMDLVKKLTIPDVVKSFYCVSSATGHEDCKEQCDGCKGFVFND